MWRHVDDVARARHHGEQAIGFRLGTLGGVGRLPQVHPVVKRAGMIRVLREHLLERGLDLDRLGVGMAVARPVVPRAQIHERLGVDRLRVEVRRNAAASLPIASANARSFAFLSSGFPVYRSISASMYARSRAVAPAFSDTAFCASSSAFGSSSAFISALMLGPSTNACPSTPSRTTDRAAPPRRTRGRLRHG